MFLQSFRKASYINSTRGQFLPRVCSLSSSFANVHIPYHRTHYTTLKNVSHCTYTHRIRSMRLSRLHPYRKVIPFRIFSPLQTGSSRGQYSFSRYLSFPLRKSLLSCSFFNFLFSFYDNTPAPMDSTRAMSFQTLSHFFSQPKRNSHKTYNLSFIKAQTTLLSSICVCVYLYICSHIIYF